ncbi:MAG: hypothetical protein JW819_04890 [Candidatus Krumholzibacteriota bacterium]|nr:hypothetical protein [Candidatus Krumholzibacteriota bacterium]
MIGRAIAIWFALAAVAVLNGSARNAWIAPAAGEHAAHVIGTAILCALIFLIALASIRWLAPGSVRRGFLVGAFWLCLTVAFEFLAGHYLFGNPWDRLLADYDLTRGRVWSLVLVVTLLSPVLAAAIRGTGRR